MNEYSTTGSHLIIDVTDAKIPDEVLFFTELLNEIVSYSHVHVLHRYSYKFPVMGITMFYVLTESHMSIHTYPEKNKLAFDFYCCRILGTEIVDGIRRIIEKYIGDCTIEIKRIIR